MIDLFAHAEARDAKISGMAQAEANADDAWSKLMLQLVYTVCKEQLLFTSDDVFDHYEAIPNPPKTHDARAFGTVMQKAAKNGWCEKTNTTRESRRKSLHASPRAIWRSKLYVYGK